MRLAVISIILLSAAVASSQTPGDSMTYRDSIVLRDTLIRSYFQIEHVPMRAGGSLSYDWTRYTTGTIPEPLSVANCDHFSNGSGTGFGGKLLTEIPFWGDASPWTFGPSLFFHIGSAHFYWTQAAPIRLPNGSISEDSTQHEIAATMDVAGIGAMFNYRVIKGLRLHGGVELGYAFHQTYQSQLHELVPGNSFLSGARDTTTGSGTLPQLQHLQPALTFGAGYEVALSRKLSAEPTVQINYPLIGTTRYWNGPTISAGVQLLFDLTPRYETVPIFEKRQVPVIVERKHEEVNPLSASIEAVALDKNGIESKVVTMMIEEVRTRNAYPILNYIFFDAGSSRIPDRYVKYTSSAEADANFKGSSERSNIGLLDLYHESLNILGDRLRKLPQAHVTLLGSTSNTGIEAGNIELAKARVEAIKKYVIDVWGIDPGRIATQASVSPTHPSPLKTAQGQEENRRVEFQISDDKALEPVMVTNIEHFASPDRILLKPSVTTSAGIASTYASIRVGGSELQSFRNDANSRKLWAPTEATLRNLRDSLSIEYDVSDSAGHHAHAHSSIPLNVIRVTSDRRERVQRFNLILFGFDESKVGKHNDRELESIAKLLPKMEIARMLVIGYTDETGEASHNDQLSEARALEVTKRLNSMITREHALMPREVISEGHGSRDELYDNALPEGRFFSRTVNVTVERASVTHY